MLVLATSIGLETNVEMTELRLDANKIEYRLLYLSACIIIFRLNLYGKFPIKLETTKLKSYFSCRINKSSEIHTKLVTKSKRGLKNSKISLKVG